MNYKNLGIVIMVFGVLAGLMMLKGAWSTDSSIEIFMDDAAMIMDEARVNGPERAMVQRTMRSGADLIKGQLSTPYYAYGFLLIGISLGLGGHIFIKGTREEAALNDSEVENV